MDLDFDVRARFRVRTNTNKHAPVDQDSQWYRSICITNRRNPRGWTRYTAIWKFLQTIRKNDGIRLKYLCFLVVIDNCNCLPPFCWLEDAFTYTGTTVLYSLLSSISWCSIQHSSETGSIPSFPWTTWKEEEKPPSLPAWTTLSLTFHTLWSHVMECLEMKPRCGITI